jgi:hypothetical protein
MLKTLIFNRDVTKTKFIYNIKLLVPTYMLKLRIFLRNGAKTRLIYRKDPRAHGNVINRNIPGRTNT